MTTVAVATVALLATVALALLRTALGPTIFDRLQAASTIGTSVMLLLALFGFLAGRTDFLTSRSFMDCSTWSACSPC